MMRWLALALLLLAPLDALAEDCTFTTSGNWTAAGTYSGTVTGSPCTLDATDNVTINAGVVATVPADSVSSDTDVAMTTGTITVNGTLAIAESGGFGVPAGGIVVGSTGSVTLQGKVLTYGSASPTFVASALAQTTNTSTNTALQIGEVRHCPLLSAGGVISDCTNTTERQQIALCWPDEETPGRCLAAGNPHPCCTGLDAGAECHSPGYDEDSGQTDQQRYTEWLNQLVVGDVVLFWDPSGGRTPSRDVNAQYTVSSIANVGTAANRCIFVDLMQGTGQESCDIRDDVAADCVGLDNPHACCTGAGTGDQFCAAGWDERAKNCQLTSRETQRCVLNAALAAGDRTLTCDTSADSLRIAAFADEHKGRYLTCTNADVNGDGTGDFVHVTQRITATTDGGAGSDTVTLLPGGFPHDVPSGSSCYLDFGWMPGDTISAYRPAALFDGDATIGNGTIAVQSGTFNADFALLAYRGLLDGQAGVDIDNSWSRDASNGPVTGAGNMNGIMRFYNNTNTFTRLQVTSPRSRDEHGIFLSGPLSGTSFEDGVWRYSVDDDFIPNGCILSGSPVTCATVSDNPAGVSYPVTLRRQRHEFKGGGCAGGGLQADCGTCGLTCGGSGGILDSNTPASSRPMVASITDVLCVACQVPDGSPIYNALVADDVLTVRNQVSIGGEGHMLGVGSTRASATLKNYVSIDAIDRYPNNEHFAAITGLSDVSLIGTQFPISGGGYGLGYVSDLSLNRVLIRDSSINQSGVCHVNLSSFTDWGHQVKDLALIGVTSLLNTSSAFCVGGVASAAKRIDINGLTIGNLPGQFTRHGTPLNWGGDDPTFNSLRTMKSVLLANYWSRSTITAMGNVTAADSDGITGPICYFNQDGGMGAQPASATVLTDQDMRFRDPEHGVYVPTADSKSERLGLRCGARNVGSGDSWPLRVLHYTDTFWEQGFTWKPRKGGSGKRGPRATP